MRSGRRKVRSALPGALGEVYLKLALFAVPEDRQIHRIARLVVPQRRDQVTRATHLLRACGDHHVAAPYSDGVGRTTWLDLLDHRSPVYGASELARGLRGQIGEIDAEVGVDGLAVLDQLVRHGDGSVGRYGEADVLRARLARRQVGHVYTDDPALTVCQGAARVTRGDGRVGLDQVDQGSLLHTARILGRDLTPRAAD